LDGFNLFCHNLGAIKTHILRWSFAKIEPMRNIKNRNLRDAYYLVMGFSIGLTLGMVIFG